MKYIDLHCDSLLIQAALGDEADLFGSQKGSVNIERLLNADCMAQVFAIFMIQEEKFEKYGIKCGDDDEYIELFKSTALKAASDHPEKFSIMNRSEELTKNYEKGAVTGILSLEDGRAVRGSFDRIRSFYDMGIRLIGLTWNFKNCFGSPNSKDRSEMAEGLSEFGKESIELMNELGIMIDVSHLSDGGFWDVKRLSKKPFLASHSNARALADHPRNLSDEMIKAIASSGGIVGLNFCPIFLKEQSGTSVSSVDDMIRHIRHIINIGGSDIMALGSDLDGIGGELEISRPEEFVKLFDALQREGFSHELIEKFAYKNAERFISDVCK